MRSIRRLLDGTGPFSGFGLACWVGALIGFMTIVLSTNGLGWWLNAHTVRGFEQNGLVTYTVAGQSHTIDDTSATSTSPSRYRTVYYLSSEPDNGILNNSVNQGLDWGISVGPFVIGAGLIATGFVKRSRRSKQRLWDDPKESYGRGISSETVQAILASKRQNGS